MADGKRDKDDKRDDRHKDRKRKRKHDSAFHEALSALKHMPSMNPGGIAPIPDEVKGTVKKSPKDKG